MAHVILCDECGAEIETEKTTRGSNLTFIASGAIYVHIVNQYGEVLRVGHGLEIPAIDACSVDCYIERFATLARSAMNETNGEFRNVRQHTSKTKAVAK